MPTKKSGKTSRAKAPKKKIEATHKPPVNRQMGMAFVIFILFISLAIISLALYRVSNEQERLLGVINSLSHEVSEKQKEVLPKQDDSLKMQYRDSEVQGLKLGYTPCMANFTGPCDDLMIYRLNKDGSKEVLVPSARALSGSPLSSELLQPLAANSDFSHVAFGAWAYGGKRNQNDKRVWIVDTSKGSVVYESSLVPDNSIYSPNMAYAAYFIEDEDGEELVYVIDLAEDNEFLAARAQSGITYKDSSSEVSINWLDDETLAVIEYQVPEEGGDPVIIGEREIKL